MELGATIAWRHWYCIHFTRTSVSISLRWHNHFTGFLYSSYLCLFWLTESYLKLFFMMLLFWLCDKFMRSICVNQLGFDFNMDAWELYFAVSVLLCNVECVLWSDRFWAMVHRTLQCSKYDAYFISVNWLCGEQFLNAYHLCSVLARCILCCLNFILTITSEMNRKSVRTERCIEVIT